MASLPTTTSAWRLHARASPATHLRLDKNVPIPALKPGDALVAIEQASINPIDWKLAALLPGFVQGLPRTMGSDFVGRVMSYDAPPGSDFVPCVGQRVYGTFAADRFRSGQGSLSQYGVCPLDALSPLPVKYVATEKLAGLGIASLTAIRLASFVKKGDRVLLLGGSTSVGILTADMVKSPLVGASHLVATASGEKITLLQKRGKIDDFVDYRDEVDVETALGKRYDAQSPDAFDVILDCVGSTKTQLRCDEFLKPGGTYFNIGASALDPNNLMASTFAFATSILKTLLLPTWLGGTSRKITTVSLLMRWEDWETLNRFLNGGHIDPLIDSVYSFQEAPKAFEKLMTGRAMGKIIIKVKGEVE